VAGSYKHAVNSKGQLRSPKHMLIATETPGDAYETIEEFYGMVWWLADMCVAMHASTSIPPSDWVEQARINYKQGIKASPGREGDEPYAEAVDDEVHELIRQYTEAATLGSDVEVGDLVKELRKRGHLSGVKA
jgi:hypothetical protein